MNDKLKEEIAQKYGYDLADDLLEFIVNRTRTTTLERVREKIVKERKEIGYNDGDEQPNIHDEILADSYDTKAEAWFAGWDNAIEKVLSLLDIT